MSDEKVDHPRHYMSGSLEVIEVIEAFQLDFCAGNVIKYVLRAGKKPAEAKRDDLRKALWYLQRMIDQETS